MSAYPLLLAALAAAAPDLSHAPAIPAAPVWAVPAPVEVQGASARVLVIPQSALPLVHVRLSVRAGSELDPPTAPGLGALAASFLKDGGAGARTGPELAQALARLGTALLVEPDVGETHFSFTVLSKSFEAALTMAADVLARPRFDPAEFPATQAQRLAEVQRRREEPRAIANDLVMRLLYADHPQAHPVLGTPVSVASVTLAQVKQFYAEHYAPERVTVIIAGEVEPKAAGLAVERALSGWRSKAGPWRPPPPVRSPPMRFVAVDRPGAPQSEIRAGWVGIARKDPLFAPMEVLETVFGGSFTSRLNQNLRERHGYTYGASARFAAWRASGPSIISTAVKADVTGASVQEIRKELKAIRAPISPAELEKGRTLFEASLVDAYSEGARAAEAVAELVDSDVGPDAWQRTLEQVRALDLKAAAGAAKALFPEGGASEWVVVGDRKVIEPALKAVVPQIEWVDVDGRPVSP